MFVIYRICQPLKPPMLTSTYNCCYIFYSNSIWKASSVFNTKEYIHNDEVS